MILIHQQPIRRRGVTLPEMLVAVAITVGMLLVIGAVFKSASDAAGKAQASNDIMQQLRTLTGQIEQDFTGFQPDMPFAIVWEAHCNNPALDPTCTTNPLGDPDDSDRWVRYDRIVFFANGDFQAPNGPGSTGYLSANLARIFYGQSLWGQTVAGGPIFDYPKMTPDTENTTVPRQILTRRAKLLTADTATGWNQWITDWSGISPIHGDGALWAGLSPPAPYPVYNSIVYDYAPIENETLAFWKNEPFVNFYNYYFLTDPTYSIPNASASFVRRPSINAVEPLGYDGVQRLYLLPDVTDFKIEVWFPGATEWFPNERDVAAIQAASLVWPIPFYGYGNPASNAFAFFWNKPSDLTQAYDIAAPTCNYYPPDGMNIDWRGEKGMQGIFDNALGPPSLSWIPGAPPNGRWPEAVKFTFTLYDKHRRHFPGGQTFTYIVKLPPRQ